MKFRINNLSIIITNDRPQNKNKSYNHVVGDKMDIYNLPVVLGKKLTLLRFKS